MEIRLDNFFYAYGYTSIQVCRSKP